jgi:hypothetical protein
MVNMAANGLGMVRVPLGMHYTRCCQTFFFIFSIDCKVVVNHFPFRLNV